jgi:bifunctional DNA-binding transcriptional regulator/antitoxin component of YhaV-PrlF toxin-antitoxin module
MNFSCSKKINISSNLNISVKLMGISTPKERVVKIGSKGEIFPPKEIRDFLGFSVDQSVILSVVQNKLIVRKVLSYQEILDRPAKVKISKQAWKQLKEEFEEELHL